MGNRNHEIEFSANLDGHSTVNTTLYLPKQVRRTFDLRRHLGVLSFSKETERRIDDDDYHYFVAAIGPDTAHDWPFAVTGFHIGEGRVISQHKSDTFAATGQVRLSLVCEREEVKTKKG